MAQMPTSASEADVLILGDIMGKGIKGGGAWSRHAEVFHR
jgi:hypothetical protein